MINVVEKFREILNKRKQTTGEDQIEKINCLGETELASGKTLKSRKAVLNAWNAQLMFG